MGGRFWIAIFCAAPLVVAAQERDRGGVARGGMGVIAGQIVSDTAAPQPLRRVIVTVRGSSIADQIAITTDDGRFAVMGLPAGRFTVTAVKAAYVETTFGSTKFGGPGAEIVISRDEHVELTMRLTYGAILAGRITDRANEPLMGVHVSTYRASAAGFKFVAQDVETDDLGMYRIFGLPAGDYIVKATTPLLSVTRDIRQPSVAEIDAVLGALTRRRRTALPGLGANESSSYVVMQAPVAYVPVYFPGVSSPQDATRVTLGASEERAGLDFTFDPVSTANIEGIITGPIQDVRTVQVSLQTADSGSALFGGVRTLQPSADGTFMFSSVAPGRYMITARANSSQTTSIRPATTRTMSIQTSGSDAVRTRDADLLYATAEVETRGENVKGVTLMLQSGATLTGRIRFDSTTLTPPRKLTQTRVNLSPIGGSRAPIVGNGFTMLREGLVRADGTFTVTGIGPGVYSFRAVLPPEIGGSGWWLRSAIFEDRDLLDTDIAFTPALNQKNVVVTFSDRHTELSGVLQTSIGQRASDCVIVVFSTDPQAWRSLARRTRTVRPASDGNFLVRDLAPGEYFMAAVTDIDPDDLMTPAFFERLVPTAIRVVLNEGERRIQDLRIVR